MTIYLYIKKHRVTGLKYLGKTEQNPYEYKGSGIRWTRHLKVHGNDVETEILRECQTNEEIREWGLYYSKLWNVVESDEWANLMEEAGDGFSSEYARKSNKKRIENGTHNFQNSDFQRQVQRERVENGTHNLLGEQNPVHKKVKDGTHNFLGGDIQRKRVENGTHHLLGGEIQRKSVKKQLENGTHNFQNSDFQRKVQRERIEKGTHPFLGDTNPVFKQLQNGTHPSQAIWSCQHCGKSGRGSGMYTKWHGNNCKLFK